MSKLNIRRLHKAFNSIRSKDSLEDIDLVNKMNKNNSYYVFPFELSLSLVNVSEIGLTKDNIKIESLGQFKKILTGTDNLLAKWVGAYKVYRANENDKFLTKEYQVGEYFKGLIYEETGGLNFNTNSYSSEYKEIVNKKQITIYSNREIKSQDAFRLYLIPEISDSIWFYIPANGYKNFYSEDKKFLRSEITFNNLTNELENSGQALEQFIQKTAPGEGYAFPKIVDNEVQLSEEHLRDIPVNSIQKEYEGSAVISTLYAYGRPSKQKIINGIVENEISNKIEVPRLLLPYKIESPIPSPFTTKPTSEIDFYIIKGTIPSFENNYNDWTSYFKGNYNFNNVQEYKGFLTSAESLKEIRETNKITNNLKTYTIFDNNFSAMFKGEKYYNNASRYLDKPYIELIGPKSISQILCNNIFTTEHLLSLPLDIKSNIAFQLADIPLIGGFISSITLGVPFTWMTSQAKLANQPLLTIVPSNLIDYSARISAQNDNQNLRIPLNFLDNSFSNEITKLSGLNSNATNLKIKLTDRIIDNNTKKIYTTLDLMEGKIKWNSNFSPTTPSCPGFIIDAVIDKAIISTNTRLTCFYQGETSVWSGSYKTKSKYTNNIRDWATIFKMSNWEITNGNKEPIPYPQIINPPSPNRNIGINGENQPFEALWDLITINRTFDNLSIYQNNPLSFTWSEEEIFFTSDENYRNLTYLTSLYSEIEINCNDNETYIFKASDFQKENGIEIPLKIKNKRNSIVQNSAFTSTTITGNGSYNSPTRTYTTGIRYGYNADIHPELKIRFILEEGHIKGVLVKSYDIRKNINFAYKTDYDGSNKVKLNEVELVKIDRVEKYKYKTNYEMRMNQEGGAEYKDLKLNWLKVKVNK